MSDHYETRCPSCGGSDEQGCYADCPTHHITALEARVRELERAGFGLYTASKTVHADKWKTLRASGVPVISTWIDEAGVGETSDFSDLWRRCIEEARSCRILLAYREKDEILKGAFIEIGAALSAGRPVFLVGDFDGMSFLHHPLVTLCADFPSAVKLVRAALNQEKQK